MDKNNSSIQQKILRSSEITDPAFQNKKTDRYHRQLNERLKNQLAELRTIFNAHVKNSGIDFNKADSLTIIYQTNYQSSFANFIIISGRDTLRSAKKLALVREVNEGGSKLQSPKKGATEFQICKSSSKKMSEPFLELRLKADTANAFRSPVSCPDDIGDNSIIIIAKKNGNNYIIQDYYLREFGFLAILKDE